MNDEDDSQVGHYGCEDLDPNFKPEWGSRIGGALLQALIFGLAYAALVYFTF